MSTDGTSAGAPSRLLRRLGTGDAVVIGLGAMIGAGVFSAIGPAARSAGNLLLVGLALAAAVAYANATSTAQLAARYPESGGAYAYGRHQLGPLWGFLAGWGFVVGKVASVAAMGLTFGQYLAPGLPRPVASAAIAALTAVNAFGIRKTLWLTRLVLVVVLGVLMLVIAALALGGTADLARLWPPDTANPYRVLRAAGLLFFAFAGYARVATLGEEVIDPARTIPRAIPLALGLTLALYAAVAVTALLAAGAPILSAAPAPLAAAVGAGRYAALAPVVRAGAAVASLGVMLSLLAGIARTAFAMAANGDLPRWLAAVHPRSHVPVRAELALGAVAATLAATVDLREAIGASSFAVLVYYAVANASAWRLPAEHRRWPRALAAAGLVGCAALAVSLPLSAVVGGAVVLGGGVGVYVLARTWPGNPAQPSAR